MFKYQPSTGTYLGDSDAPELFRNAPGSTNAMYQLVDANDAVENYDADGNLLSITTREGFVTSLSYDTHGRLAQVTDQVGRSLLINYTQPDDTTIASITLPSGVSIFYTYTSGNLTHVLYPDNNYEDLGYTSIYTNTSLLSDVSYNGVAFTHYTYFAAGAMYSTSGTPVVGSTSLVGANSTFSNFTYSSNNTTVTAAFTTPLGQRETYTAKVQNQKAKLTNVSAPCPMCGIGNVASQTYDTAGYLQSRTDFNGKTATYTYDDTRGLETQRVEGTGTALRRTNTAWNVNYRLPDQRTVLNSSGVTEAMTKWAYNSRGQTRARCAIDPAVTGATSYVCGSLANAPLGVRQWTYTYCDAVGAGCPLIGLLLGVDGPRTDASDITSYAYYQTTDLSDCASLGGTCHSAGDLQYVTNAMGQVTTYVSYDKNGRVTRLQDANGTFTDMTYHARGWLLTRTVRANADGSPNSSLDATTTFAYDNTGNVTRVTQPDGAYLAYTYDTAHRLTNIADNYNNHITYTLDAAGNRTAENTYDPSNALNFALSRQYDALNLLKKVLNNAGATVQTYQNPADAPPTGTVYNDGYDGNGNTVYSVDGLGVGTEQLYDPLNRLVKTLQDHVTGSPAATHDATTQYAYDTRDNLRSVTDPDNLVTSYTYDGLNNLTALSSPDTSSSSYTYDVAGNRATQTDARGVVTTYSYDALNRLTGISYPTSSLNIAYSYDAPASGCYNAGRLTTITDNSGSTTYCYDRRGNILSKVQVTNGTTLTTSYAYTIADRLASITYPSGAIVSYGRDTVGRVTSVNYQANANAGAVTVLSNINYYPFGPANQFTFGNSRVLTKTYQGDRSVSSVSSSASGGLQVYYGPDVLGNIRSASTAPSLNPPTASYAYDNLYRLTETDLAGAVAETYTYDKTGDRLSKTPQGQGAQTYAYATGTHHVASVAGVSRGYDNAGNTTQNGSATFAYDDRNRLSTGGGVSYNYNGKGERVFKTGTLFSYDEGGHTLGEYTTAGALGAEYIYADGTPVGYVTGGVVYYIETDALGTPRQVILPGATTSTDTQVWKWDYFASNSAFGENAPSVQTITFNLRFPGQYFDAETGLNYNYFRDYEPGTGRYVESDPKGLGAGINTYRYVDDNPLADFDYYGLYGSASGCGKKQKQAITDAEEIVRIQWKHCFGKNCTEPSSTISDTAKGNGFIDVALSSMDIDCSTSNWRPGANEISCAWTRGTYHVYGPPHGTITLAPISSDPEQCWCLSRTLFHEVLHFADDVQGQRRKDYDHSTIDPIVEHCAQCPLPPVTVRP